MGASCGYTIRDIDVKIVYTLHTHLVYTQYYAWVFWSNFVIYGGGWINVLILDAALI